MDKLFNSRNPDVNDLRENGIHLVNLYRDKHLLTIKPSDLTWYDRDWELLINGFTVKECDEYVNSHFDELNTHYPFLVTEWFCEWYEVMPDIFLIKERVTMADWTLFFSLAYPLPKALSIPFSRLVRRLDVKQMVLVKRNIVNDIWIDPELRRKILRGELVPSIFTYYMPYQEIRRRIISRHKAAEEEIQREKTGIYNRQSPLEKYLAKLYADNKETIKTLLEAGKSIEEIAEIICKR